MALAPDLALVAASSDIAVGAASVVVALDGVMDPQNFGAVIRSAVALGATAILWPEHASAPLSPATFRASAGAIEHAVLCRVPALPEAHRRPHRAGASPPWRSTPRGRWSSGDVDLRGPVAIVIGAEDKGTRRPVRRACRYTARLPMAGPIASLNASVAGAIALYEVLRQRRAASERPAWVAPDARSSPASRRTSDVRHAVPSRLGHRGRGGAGAPRRWRWRPICRPTRPTTCAPPAAAPGSPTTRPLTLWLLALSDRWSAAPVELRVRVWAVAFSFATGLAVRGAGPGARGGSRRAARWPPGSGRWALLPMAGGFVTTPDGPLLLAVALRRCSPLPGPLAGLALLAGALAKVVALPVAALLAAVEPAGADPARAWRSRRGPCWRCPCLLPSLRFQLAHAYGAGSAARMVAPARRWGRWSRRSAAQALLWSPRGPLAGALRALRALPVADRALVGGLTALVLASALVRGVPPEPNWWAPAALLVVVAFGGGGRAGLSPRPGARSCADRAAAHRDRGGPHPPPLPAAAPSEPTRPPASTAGATATSPPRPPASAPTAPPPSAASTAGSAEKSIAISIGWRFMKEVVVERFDAPPQAFHSRLNAQPGKRLGRSIQWNCAPRARVPGKVN